MRPENEIVKWTPESEGRRPERETGDGKIDE